MFALAATPSGFFPGHGGSGLASICISGTGGSQNTTHTIEAPRPLPPSCLRYVSVGEDVQKVSLITLD